MYRSSVQFLRDLKASNPDGVDGVIDSVNHAVRSQAEIDAATALHFLVFVQIGDTLYFDEVDSSRDLQKDDSVHVDWTTTSEGDGMPVLS